MYIVIISTYNLCIFSCRGVGHIEWDVWEPQRLRESKAFALGWDTCLSSIYTPCKKQIKGRSIGQSAAIDIVEQWTRPALYLPSRTSKYDYFADLEDTRVEQRQVGRALNHLVGDAQGKSDGWHTFSRIFV